MGNFFKKLGNMPEDPGSYRLQSGQYGGMTLEEVSSTPAGLWHLDHLLCRSEKEKKNTLLARCLRSFMSSEDIQRELEDAQDRVEETLKECRDDTPQ